MKISWLALSVILLAQPAMGLDLIVRKRPQKANKPAVTNKKMWWKETPPVDMPTDMIRVLRKYSSFYEKEIPNDYRRSLAFQHEGSWSEMTQWYKLASQKVMRLGDESTRLYYACVELEDVDRAAVRKAADLVLDAANKLLMFIDTAEWGEGLAKPMRGEVRKAHLHAIEGWKQVSVCAHGKQALELKKSGTPILLR